MEKGQALSDLAIPASESALKAAGISPEELDLIVIGTSTADMLTPSAGCIIQHRLGAKNAVAFDINAAWPGFIYGLGGAQEVERGTINQPPNNLQGGAFFYGSYRSHCR